MLLPAAFPPLRRCPALAGVSPVEAAAGLRHLPGMVFLDSALETHDPARLSILAARPSEWLRGDLGRDWPTLERALARRETLGGGECGRPCGFLAGAISYDGEFCFGVYEEALFFCHRTGEWEELGSLSGELRSNAAPPASAPVQFLPDLTREQYCHMVMRAHEYIAAGDIYQVNLAHRFTSSWSGDPFAFYSALRRCSPAPFGSFLALPSHTILSASPESFLQMSGRSIRTRPIKGTRPRRRDPAADEKSASDLLTSPKEIAELVMITDLERSDLGQVCEWGSVAVRELLAIERYEQVFHLVSTIEGRLRPSISHVGALRACFPGGSITGAPKKRARQIIAELEAVPRGLYTGALGWLGFNGESQFSIAIRTVIAEPSGRAHFHVGAGIVADSVPEREWQETWDKAAGILLAAERL